MTYFPHRDRWQATKMQVIQVLTILVETSVDTQSTQNLTNLSIHTQSLTENTQRSHLTLNERQRMLFLSPLSFSTHIYSGSTSTNTKEQIPFKSNSFFSSTAVVLPHKDCVYESDLILCSYSELKRNFFINSSYSKLIAGEVGIPGGMWLNDVFWVLITEWGCDFSRFRWNPFHD